MGKKKLNEVEDVWDTCGAKLLVYSALWPLCGGLMELQFLKQRSLLRRKEVFSLEFCMEEVCALLQLESVCTCRGVGCK